ncbi:MAG: hypothetical protein BWY75_03434 [bacterium ADurb.Bin425]|nr:MAG: hypothetical protein BWY75_03434 [bacterium ADurb.Bin425]
MHVFERHFGESFFDASMQITKLNFEVDYCLTQAAKAEMSRFNHPGVNWPHGKFIDTFAFYLEKMEAAVDGRIEVLGQGNPSEWKEIALVRFMQIEMLQARMPAWYDAEHVKEGSFEPVQLWMFDCQAGI